jgi:hypothetical protein
MILVFLLLLLLCGYTMTMSLYKPSLRRKKNVARNVESAIETLQKISLSLYLHNLSNKIPSNKIFIPIDNEKQKSKKTKQKKNAARNVESAIETLRQQLSLSLSTTYQTKDLQTIYIYIYIDNEKQKQ